MAPCPNVGSDPDRADPDRVGWKITSPAVAFADPVYQLIPEPAAPGQSLLLSMARSMGVAKFAGWARLVDDGDFEMEALKAKGL
jgi:hypothetical protein